MVLRTDRHMPRKRISSLIRAMVPVFEAVPALDLVIHNLPDDQGGNSGSHLEAPERLRGRVHPDGWP